MNNNFIKYAEKYAKVNLTEAQTDKFQALADFLLSYNQKVNLTAIRDLDGVYLKHFIDSLTVNLAVSEIEKAGTKIQNLADVGSGAGFPALPLAIIYEDKKITAIDSVGKKTKFISEAAKILGLENIKVINDRAEKIVLQKFGLVVSRAVAQLPQLLDWCLPLVKNGGYFVAMKNAETSDQEISDSQKNLQQSSVEIINRFKIEIPNLTNRELIICKKK